MDRQRMEALAEQQHGVVARAQLTMLGFTAKAILHQRRRGRLHSVARGVYRLSGVPVTALQRAVIAVLAAGPDAVLSHESAAALHGLPGFDLEPLIVTVSRHGRRHLARVTLEQSLKLPAHHVTVVDGIPCTTVARTLFDLCANRRMGRVARTMDTALAKKWVTVPALWRVLIDLAEHGREGTAAFRTLLQERRGDYVAPESELERRFIALTCDHGLPEPERQVDLGSEVEWIGRVDFLFRSARIVVEVDGAEFHDGFLDRRNDEQRDARLRAAGWFVLRFRWADVIDRPAAVAQSIRFRCELMPSEGHEVAPKRGAKSR